MTGVKKTEEPMDPPDPIGDDERAKLLAEADEKVKDILKSPKAIDPRAQPLIDAYMKYLEVSDPIDRETRKRPWKERNNAEPRPPSIIVRRLEVLAKRVKAFWVFRDDRDIFRDVELVDGIATIEAPGISERYGVQHQFVISRAMLEALEDEEIVNFLEVVAGERRAG